MTGRADKPLQESMSIEEFAATGGLKRRHKYGTAAAPERTWRGRVYDSKAEMRYAQLAWSLVGQRPADGPFLEVVEQPRVQLGEDTVCRPDFLIIPRVGCPYYVDVKGAVTKDFVRIKKLWAKYGRLELHIVVETSRGAFKTTEIISPAKERSQ